MEKNLEQIVQEQQNKIDKIYISVEKTRRYLFWTMIATVVFFVLPLLGLALFLPSLIGSYTAALDSIAF